ncbi:hypothetical protein RUM44_010823 [Polyplax serrata]|uniref:Gamma-secretase-activating protein C-terminal domain-containing protein n=1 Tax=Polyplax serrata TaxID=468196 RepID=A0ABR1AN96_POLSC
MVVFDNLARILQEIVTKSTTSGNFKEWKLLGHEAKGQLTVGWIEETFLDGKNLSCTCIGLYQPKTNKLQVLFKLHKVTNIIQASVNSSRSLVSYIVKEKNDPSEDGPDWYKHYLASIKKDENDVCTPEITEEPETLGLETNKQIMTNFLGITPKEISRLLVFIHLECITLYRLKKENSEPLTTIKTDTITKSFIWAQWDCDIQSLYFIHFRKTSLLAEDEDPEKREESPTLSCFQFHEDLPHETVLNIPLNLPSIPKSTDASCQIYEDDPLPLRVHDCSLDLMVISDSCGTVCICHHYLYQPVQSSPTEEPEGENTVHFAYSITLLHHGRVIHSVVPGIPWNSAKTMRPVFALLGYQYLVVYAAGIFTHLLDIGLSHEPNCHILMSGILSMVPRNASRLIAIKSEFTEIKRTEEDTELFPAVMVDLCTMDLIEFEISNDDLINCLTMMESVSNRLSILHYFLVHAGDFDAVEEALSILLKNPTDINVPKFLQEVLVGGAYCLVQKDVSSEANPLLNFLPMTSLEYSRQTETKLNSITCKTTQEILWNTAMMLLSPQQRLIPFNTDIWRKLWDRLIKLADNNRFKPSQAADKLLVSLGCYQPEALSCCSTPMSPGPAPATTHFETTNVNQDLTILRKNSGTDLPFLEVDSCTANTQQQIISVNLRELSLHLMKNCLREPHTHVNPVSTSYVTAQLDASKLLCHFLGKIAGIEDEMKSEKGFSLIKNLHQKQRLILFTYYQRFYNAADTLAFPVPQGFTSFFCYLGFMSLSFQNFMMFLQNNVFDLQIDVMREIMQDIEDTKEGVDKKLRLLLLLPRSRARRLLYSWPHGVSLMIRAREHALNILSGVQSSHYQGLSQCKPTAKNSRGLAAFPSAGRLSPLDTFLDLLTAKASLTDLDFNLLIDATISSTQDIYN